METPDVLDPAVGRSGTSVVASRALAVDRVLRGGVLALVGAGISLLPDALNWGGLPLMLTSGAGIVGLAVGAVWASLGAKHLLRYGRTGSPLVLISIAGLSGSALLWLATFYLLTDGPSSLLSALSAAALVGTFGFGAIVLVTVLLLVVRTI